jgi:hypothetical protein
MSRAYASLRLRVESPGFHFGFREAVHHCLKHFATVLIIAELIETGAGWSEQHNIAGLCGISSAPNSVL